MTDSIIKTSIPCADNIAEKSISTFYNTVGWETNGGITEDARRWEDLREHAKEYVSKCRMRIMEHIPDNGDNILDMASGPIQYEEYLEYSKNFKKRYCVDLSIDALEEAKRKIGDHGVFLHGSFFDILLKQNFFDCALSLHTIYHIDKDKQEEAVRKLIYVTKPGKPIIIVYGNPHTCYSLINLPQRLVRKILSKLQHQLQPTSGYHYAHPIAWWNRFADMAIVNIFPWRSFDSDTQKMLIPNNAIGSKIFDILFKLEERFPNFFVRYFQYPLIVLTKI